MISFMIGTDKRIASGVSSRCALYCSYASCRKVGPGGSKATPICVGFSFFNTSSNVFTKPKIAEVLKPLELIRGFLIKA